MKNTGFTLIELMIVVAIIGIMVTYSIPSYQQYTVKSQIKEALAFSEQLKPNIEAFYKKNKRFPKDNQEAGLPPADKLIGNHILKVTVFEGQLDLMLGNKINKKMAGEILSIQPMHVEGSPESPISWACGYASASKGLLKAGQNHTSLKPFYLPVQCRI